MMSLISLASQRVLVSGATGLIGSRLMQALRLHGAHTVGLGRNPVQPAGEVIVWNPAAGQLDPAALENFTAMVHLAGEPIAGGRWNAARRARIRKSRVDATALLARSVAQLATPPATFICASATGFYGDRGEEPLNETSSAGQGFLPEVCTQWEAACEPLRARGVRVLHARLGLVLSRDGGALATMLPAYRLGLGGRLGTGRQWWSWIHIDDALRALLFMLGNDQIAGPVNLTAPAPVRNAEFSATLSRVLGRRALLPAPALALRLLLGEMADALLLASAQVAPHALQQARFSFTYPTLESALRQELHRP